MSTLDAQGELIRAYGAAIMRKIEHARHLRNFGFKLYTPRARYFGTLPEACAAAEDYRKQTGVFVAIEEPRRRKWVIISTDPHDLGGEPLYWSNVQGWVDKESADRFTYSERCAARLPIHGAWAI